MRKASISVMDFFFVWIKLTNTIATNVSINVFAKNQDYKIDCFILHTVLLVIILLLIITITSYQYTKHRSTQKSIDLLMI